LCAENERHNVVAVLAAGNATPAHVVRMTWYVTDMDEYRRERSRLGEAYRATMGDHYPAMTLVAVSALVEPGARVEIEATAVVPDAKPA
jgi:enamine deaminase RidA (YjgF/YER057c/UK114 family)